MTDTRPDTRPERYYPSRRAVAGAILIGAGIIFIIAGIVIILVSSGTKGL